MNKLVYLIIGLLVISGVLGFQMYSNSKEITLLSNDLNSAKNKISDLDNIVNDKIEEINSLNEKAISLESELNATKQTVQEKEQQIIKSTQQIEELTKVSDEQKDRIADIIKAQEALDEEGKIIVDNYKKSLVLYDNSVVFTNMYPFFEQVKDDSQDYSKLGIPFFYFKDEVKTEGNRQILGEYSGLYDYIYIYKGANGTSVIYHEIAHIIFKTFFLDNDNNLNVWVNLYNNLKNDKLLSSAYSYDNEVEGFAEEYAYYKTGLNPNQPQAVKDLFRQVDGFLS